MPQFEAKSAWAELRPAKSGPKTQSPVAVAEAALLEHGFEFGDVYAFDPGAVERGGEEGADLGHSLALQVARLSRETKLH